jgi:LysR family transcriptional activator of glutamate synthase operon
MAFLIFSMEELNANYKYRIISEHHLSIIAREEHPLAKRDAINISELRNEYFIMHGPNTNEYDNAMNWCKMSGFYPRITGEYDYVETVLMLVQAGAGISILSDAAPIDGMKGLVSIPLENAPIVYNGVFWNPHPKTPAVEMFIEEFIRSRSNRKRLEVEDT